MVTFAAGYIAGVFCAIVSHPADNIVSVINKNPGTTAGQSERISFTVDKLRNLLSFERNGLVQRLHQGSRRPYHHDRYINCSAVVHLRWCQGCSPSPTPTTTTNARITSPEVGGTRKERISCCPNQVYSVQIKNDLPSIFASCFTASWRSFSRTFSRSLL